MPKLTIAAAAARMSLLLVATMPSPAGAQANGSQGADRLCDRAMNPSAMAAREALEASASQASGAEASFYRGCRAASNQKLDVAAREFEAAIKADTGNPVYHFWAGRVYGEQAQHANVLRQPGLARRTKAEFERAVALDPSYISAREGLMQYYMQAPGIVGGSMDKAREQAAEIAKMQPYRGGFAIASVAQRAKDTTRLFTAYEQLVAQFPDSIAPHLSIYNARMARKQWREAWSVIERFDKARPGVPLTLYAVGRLSAESGERLEQGEAALRKYLQHAPGPGEPNHAATNWRLGTILERRGDRAGARTAYQAALSIDPEHKPSREALSKLK